MEKELTNNQSCSNSKLNAGKNVSFINWKQQLFETLQSQMPNKQIIKNCDFRVGSQSNVEPGVKNKVEKEKKKQKLEIEIKCDQCQAKFNNKTKFTTHKRRVHTKPNKCAYCDYKTGSTYILKHHILFKHTRAAYSLILDQLVI